MIASGFFFNYLLKTVRFINAEQSEGEQERSFCTLDRDDSASENNSQRQWRVATLRSVWLIEPFLRLTMNFIVRPWRGNASPLSVVITAQLHLVCDRFCYRFYDAYAQTCNKSDKSNCLIYMDQYVPIYAYVKN